MFIDHINYQNISTKIDFSKKNEKSNNFIDCIKTALGEISDIQNNTQKEIEAFSLNNSRISLNDIMMNLQKSSISMEMAIQIRNKVVSAYQEIMNLQV